MFHAFITALRATKNPVAPQGTSRVPWWAQLYGKAKWAGGRFSGLGDAHTEGRRGWVGGLICSFIPSCIFCLGLGNMEGSEDSRLNISLCHTEPYGPLGQSAFDINPVCCTWVWGSSWDTHGASKSTITTYINQVTELKPWKRGQRKQANFLFFPSFLGG